MAEQQVAVAIDMGGGAEEDLDMSAVLFPGKWRGATQKSSGMHTHFPKPRREHAIWGRSLIVLLPTKAGAATAPRT